MRAPAQIFIAAKLVIPYRAPPNTELIENHHGLVAERMEYEMTILDLQLIPFCDEDLLTATDDDLLRLQVTDEDWARLRIDESDLIGTDTTLPQDQTVSSHGHTR